MAKLPSKSFETWLKRRSRIHLNGLTKARLPFARLLPHVEVSLVLTTDAGIRRLNKKWRGKDKATDVLSFPLFTSAELKALASGGEGPNLLLGDVVISADTAARQAKEHGKTFRQELDLLLVHGILHLLGFDHELSAADERKMRRMERKLLGHRGLT